MLYLNLLEKNFFSHQEKRGRISPKEGIERFTWQNKKQSIGKCGADHIYNRSQSIYHYLTILNNFCYICFFSYHTRRYKVLLFQVQHTLDDLFCS